MNIAAIQDELRRQQIDGWLFFDHHYRDPLAYRVLGLSADLHVTRRWYYLIPAQGDPAGLVHRIESGNLAALPGHKLQYSSWLEQRSGLAQLLAGRGRVAMQYSPDCAIPYVSLVDAGTVELVRGLGAEVVSSAELIQAFEARLDDAALESHLEAGRRVDRVRAAAFALIGERIRAGISIDEIEVRDFIMARFTESGLYTDHGPIVGVNAHSGNPHYSPEPATNQPILAGDFVLIDMWAKLQQLGAIYYDITWTGFCGDTVPERIQTVFEAVRTARDTAVEFVQNAFARSQIIQGYQVDDAARGSIERSGFGPNFVHRTGHSIGIETHGNGANMDNLETHDERKVMPWSCFSIEPGIYLPDFGVRLELNIFIDAEKPRVTGAVQRELIRI